MTALLRDATDGMTLRQSYRRAVDLVSIMMHVPVSRIVSGVRHHDAVQARRLAIAAVIFATECSNSALARAIGMDHTTVRLARVEMMGQSEVAAVAVQLSGQRGIYEDPSWMLIARANGWHEPSACTAKRDENAGGEL